MSAKSILVCLVLFSFSATLIAKNTDTEFTIVDSLNEALQYAKTDSVTAHILNELCWEYGLNNPDKAIECGQRALEISKRTEFPALAGDSYNLIGIVHYYQGSYKNAIQNLLQSKKIRELIGDEDGAYVCLNNLAMVYQVQGKFELALEKYQQYYEMCNRTDNLNGMATALNNMAGSFKRLKKYALAKHHYRRAIGIFGDIKNNLGVAQSINNIGNVYELEDSIDLAIESYSKSLQLFRELGIKQGIAVGLNNLALMYKANGDYDKAIQNSLMSLKLVMEIGFKDEIKSAYQALASSYSEMGNFQNASEYMHLFLQMSDSLFNEDKNKEIGKIEAKYEFEKEEGIKLRAAQEQAEINMTAKSRSDNLQYSGILIVLVSLLGGLLFMGKLFISIRLAEALTFFTFLLFFEFTLVLLDPLIEQYSAGAPAIKLLFNAVLAAGIFPLHSFFEEKFKSRMAK